MKNLSLFKIIVFYLVMCITVLLSIESIHHWTCIGNLSNENQRQYFYKESLFLLAAAIIIFFSIKFYKNSYQSTELSYQKLFNGSPLPMYVMNVKSFKILAVNNAMVRLYGYTESEFLKMSALDIRPEDQHQHLLAFMNNYDGISNDSGKWLHLKKNGESFHVQINFHSIPLLKEQAFVIMITDLSKSINDEKKINDLLHLYETVNKATNDVIWDCDLVAGKLTWMQGYYETYGYDDESSPSAFWDMEKVHSEDRQRVVDSIRSALADKQKEWIADYRYICADGTVKHIRDRGFIIFNQDDESVRMIGAMRDMEEQKKNERQLISHNDQLKEIAWINSHQVRRPLSNIIGLINLIRDAVDQKDEILQLIDLLAISSKELDDAVILINRQTMDGKKLS